MEQAASKKTPLFDWHSAHGANMGIFGGYLMPMWYPDGVKTEHLAVLTRAGIFDTSHMALLLVQGSESLPFLQQCFTNDLNSTGPRKDAPLAPGRCMYGAFLTEAGEVVDDTIVFRFDPIHFMVVVNAGMGPAVAEHLGRYTAGRRVEIIDLTDRIGKMDIQGPASARILEKILKQAGEVFAGMPYFSFKGHFDPASSLAAAVRLRDGTPLMLSRTGYTGEFGFEIFIEPSHLVKLWEMIRRAGEIENLAACGLAARDSLRTGAMLPLSHQDIGHWPYIHHPWHFALPLTADGSGFSKSFIGDRALLGIENPQYTRAFVGDDLRKVPGAGKAVVVDGDGSTIGIVLTCVTDMGIDWIDDRLVSITSPDRPAGFAPRGLSCGFIRTEKPLSAGTEVELSAEHRTIKVRVVDDIRPHRSARQAISKML